MPPRLFFITLTTLALVPFGATAQVDAGDDVVLECESEDGTEYTLNGTALGVDLVNVWTTDPEVDLENADTLTPTGLFPLGDTVVTLTSTAGLGDPISDSVTVTVEDTTPPVVMVNASPFFLWPPNHDMREVEARVRVEDGCSGEDDFDVVLVDVESDEPDNSTGDGNTTNDIQGANRGTDDRSILLRAERKGNGNGRVYTLTYEVTDGSGNKTEAEANVYVPHDASDLKDLIAMMDGGDIDPICPSPLDAVEQLTEIFPGIGSVRSERACNKICKVWAKSCTKIAKGSARCVSGEQKALAVIGKAECKETDDKDEFRACKAEIKADFVEQKAKLKDDAAESQDICNKQGQRCKSACTDLFDDVVIPIEDE
jgi:hypothetical protein